MIEGIGFIIFGSLLIVVAYIGPDKVNQNRFDFMAAWDKHKGKSPEDIERRHSRPHYVIALLGAIFGLFGILQILESLLY